MASTLYVMYLRPDLTMAEPVEPKTRTRIPGDAVESEERPKAEDWDTSQEYVLAGDVTRATPVGEAVAARSEAVELQGATTATQELLRSEPVFSGTHGAGKAGIAAPSQRRSGVTILAALGIAILLLLVGMLVTMISSIYLINPKTAVLGIFVLLFLVVETLVGMALQRRRGRG